MNSLFTIIIASFMAGVYVTVFLIHTFWSTKREKTEAEKLEDEIDDGTAW